MLQHKSLLCLATSCSNSAQDAITTVEQPRKSDEIRVDLVDRVRAEIASGNYETEEKWETALEKLMGDIV